MVVPPRGVPTGGDLQRQAAIPSPSLFLLFLPPPLTPYSFYALTLFLPFRAALAVGFPQVGGGVYMRGHGMP